MLCGLGISGTVVICCGKGNNAGDGFVLARHLDLRGHNVRVLLWADPAELTGDAEANYRILEKTGVPIEPFAAEPDAARLDRELAAAGWLVDALLGTGARGEPRPPLDTVIDRINAAGRPVLAVDRAQRVGLRHGRAGHAHDPRRPHLYLRHGQARLLRPQALPYVGGLHVLDIGAPRKLIEELLAEQAERRAPPSAMRERVS